MAYGFNFFSTNSGVLRGFATLAGAGTFLKNVSFGDILLQVNELSNGKNALAVFVDGTGTADDHVVIDGKPYAVEDDGDESVLLFTNSIDGNSLSSGLLDAYVCGGKLCLTSDGIGLFASVTGPDSYGSFMIGTKRLRYAKIGGRNVLVVRGVP